MHGSRDHKLLFSLVLYVLLKGFCIVYEVKDWDTHKVWAEVIEADGNTLVIYTELWIILYCMKPPSMWKAPLLRTNYYWKKLWRVREVYIQWNCTCSSLQADPWESLWRVIEVPKDWQWAKIDPCLNRLGKSGWDVLSFIAWRNTGTSIYWQTFKGWEISSKSLSWGSHIKLHWVTDNRAFTEK